MRKSIYLFLIFVCIVNACSLSSSPLEVNSDASKDKLSAFLRQLMLDNNLESKDEFEKLDASHLISDFYSRRDFIPAWITDFMPNYLSREALDLIKDAKNYGLEASHYNSDMLNKLYYQLSDKLYKPKLEELANFETVLTNSCLLFMCHISKGRLIPDTVLYKTQDPKLSVDLSEKLYIAHAKRKVKSGILEQQPQLNEYKLLQAGLVNFLKNNKITNDVINIPDFKKDSLACLKKTAELLVYFGYLEADTSLRKDSAFVKSLKKFQKYNGLNEDGRVGKNTVKLLQVNLYERHRQIVINLERLRWENKFPDKYVWINIPAYRLKAVTNDCITDTFKVIVGAKFKHTHTPLLNSKIKYFKTYPFWYVPYSISSKEMLPKIKKDTAYLSKGGYKVFDKEKNKIDPKTVNWDKVSSGDLPYTFRQGSGRGNSLGTIKFIFPNEYSVYLHDTPNRYLFRRDIRAFSHGCMRLHRPRDFAKFLLKYENKHELADSFEHIMNRRRKLHYVLDKPLPLFVRYISCDADSNKNVYFYLDIYKKDQELKDRFFNEAKTEELLVENY